MAPTTQTLRRANPRLTPITRSQWRGLILYALAVMLLTTLPYLAGALSQTPERRYGWFTFGLEDGHSYLAKMRQGANGAWLFTLVYTSEPHDPVLAFLPYLLLGKVAAFFAPTTSPAFVDWMLLVFHTARLIFGFGLILITYCFIGFFVRQGRLRWLTLTLVCLGGGAGWLLLATGRGNWLGTPPVDLYLPEGYTFYLLYGLPHLSLARIGLLGGLLLTIRALKDDEPRRWLRWSILAGLCWLIMAVCVPFYAGILAAILGAWGLVVWTRMRHFPAQLFWRCVVGVVFPAPVLLYSLYVFNVNPAMRAFQAQNVLLSPHPAHFIAGYGLLAVLALPAVVRKFAVPSKRYLLLIGWLAIGPILAYMPLEVQRRLLEGIFVPLCIMAVLGLRLFWLWLYRKVRAGFKPAPTNPRLSRGWVVIAMVVVGLSLGTTFMILLLGTLESLNPASELFHSANEVAALDWLNANAPAGAVVLTPDRGLGNYAPARTNLRVYYGHSIETIRFTEKQVLAAKFYAGQLTNAFLEPNNIQYVIFGPGRVRLQIDTGELQPIYDQAGYQIYRVRDD